ncbi:MAG TPA: hypothetical protein VFZ42_14725 [Chitinophagaceae bacterium]
MTDRLIHLLLLKLKLLSIILLTALLSIFLFSFSTSRSMADDIWKQLGMTRDQGLDGVKQSFLNGYLYYYGAKNARNIALNNRAAVAKDLLTYTKQYVSSPVFKGEYEKLRRDAKPEAEVEKIRTKEEIRKEKIAETEKSIAKTEEIMKQKDMAKIMQPTLDMLKKTLQEYKEPNNKYIESFYQYELRESEDRKRSYQERLARWEKEYPADFNLKIKERLQQFLTLSATVDFDAELKQVGGKKKFVNPTYEGKSYDWKQIYRAGKDVIEPARGFAEKWLLELDNR